MFADGGAWQGIAGAGGAAHGDEVSVGVAGVVLRHGDLKFVNGS